MKPGFPALSGLKIKTMITEEFAKQFAYEWVLAWNAHDLKAVLSHYEDDFDIETPMALKLVPDSHGILKGKEAIKEYWEIGLQHIPELHFEILDILIGINSITIYYINTATGRKSAENLFFNENRKVTKALVMYS